MNKSLSVQRYFSTHKNKTRGINESKISKAILKKFMSS